MAETQGQTGNFDFGDVIKTLKSDNFKKAYRNGWNGKGIYITYMAQVTAPEGQVQSLPYLVMNTTDVQSEAINPVRGIVPWLASQTDMLANDWIIE